MKKAAEEENIKLVEERQKQEWDAGRKRKQTKVYEEESEPYEEHWFNNGSVIVVVELKVEARVRLLARLEEITRGDFSLNDIPERGPIYSP